MILEGLFLFFFVLCFAAVITSNNNVEIFLDIAIIATAFILLPLVAETLYGTIVLILWIAAAGYRLIRILRSPK